MSNPLARLIAQAEFGAADLIHRSVERVVGPIRAKSQEIVGEVVDATTRRVKTLLIKVGIAAFAGVMALVAVIYLLASLYAALLPRFGAVDARLIMAGLFLVLAVVGVVVLMAWPKTSAAKAADQAHAAAQAAADHSAAEARQAAARVSSAAHETADAASDAADAGTSDLKSGFEALVNALGDAGFRREQAGLRAGLALAGQLKPMQIVSLALIGGFVAGMRQSRRRR